MSEVPEQSYKSKKNGKTTLLLSLIVVGMFVFGFFVMPQLYRIVCDATGIGISGSSGTGRALDASVLEVDEDRWVTVQFDTTLNENLQWEFQPETKMLKVHPGQAYNVNYFAKNKTDKAIVAQAVPGITPWQASTFFNKTECFCFTQQTLEAGESKDMPLRFVVDPALPEDIKVLTLSYTFMDTNRDSIQDPRELNFSMTKENEG